MQYILFPVDGGDIAFITYEKGEPKAKIRFKKEDFAKPIAEKWVGMETVDIKELKVVGSLLEVILSPVSSLLMFVVFTSPEVYFYCFVQTKSLTHVCVEQTKLSYKVFKSDIVISQGEEEENFLAESVKDLKNRRNKNRHGHKRKGGFNNHHGGKRGRR